MIRLDISVSSLVSVISLFPSRKRTEVSPVHKCKCWSSLTVFVFLFVLEVISWLVHLRIHQESRPSLSGRWSPLLGAHWQIIALLINTTWDSSSRLLSHSPFLAWGLGVGSLLFWALGTCVPWGHPFVRPGPCSQERGPPAAPHPPVLGVLFRCFLLTPTSPSPTFRKISWFLPGVKRDLHFYSEHFVGLGMPSQSSARRMVCVMSLSLSLSWQPLVALLCCRTCSKFPQVEPP